MANNRTFSYLLMISEVRLTKVKLAKHPITYWLCALYFPKLELPVANGAALAYQPSRCCWSTLLHVPRPYGRGGPPTERDGPCHACSMRSSPMIGNLWITLGINSRSKSPPASVAIEIKKVLATTGAVMLGSG
jgi:hypothetical protein